MQKTLTRDGLTPEQARALLAARGSLPMMGAAVPSQVAHPLGPPTVSGTTITVETMLNQPTRVTRMIMDLSLQRFLLERVFSSAGGVSGGAVVYDQATLNELYADRDVQRVAPGAEFPIITSQRQVPFVAEVEKWGGKVFITDEARDRNNTAAFTNQIRQLANTVVRKLNQRVVETLEASITTSGQVTTGNNWSAVITAGTSASTATAYPGADFAKAAMLADQQELGVVYDLWILNPQEYMNLAVVYGSRLGDLLSSNGISLYVSNRVPAGTAYVVAGTTTGEYRVEKPLSSETYREPENERTWVQTSVRPVMYVTNPYAVLKFTGLHG